MTKKRNPKKPEEPAKPPEDRTALILLRTIWVDPKRPPTVQVVRRPLMDGRSVEVHLGIDLRTVSTLEIRTIRRPLLDVEGTVKDAERLANEE